MITLRIDATNYQQCSHEGTRGVPGSGIKVDLVEFATDAATLGLWHLHNGGCVDEGTGLEDASGGGHTLINHGATPGDYGYQFVRDEADYMEVSFPGESSRSLLTIEAWVQGWDLAPGNGGYIAQYHRDASDHLSVWAFRADSPTNSLIRAALYLQATLYYASWTGAEAEAILASGQPWHVAGVLNAPGELCLFVNGTLRASRSAVPSLPTGDWTLYLGRNADSSVLNLSAIVDEVRLSSAARYAAAFSIQRLLASGTCTSPVLDCNRTGAVWLDLLSTHELPNGSGLAWEVCAADGVDSSGPTATWQPYSGDPSGLPQGRYFQWRATLSSSPDRLASPTLEHIDALASENGCNIYHATGAGPDLLDYGEPWACAGPGITQLVTGPLDAAAVHWFSIRPIDGREIESPIAQGEVRLELDSQGQPVPNRPAGVLALSARPLPSGCAKVTWSYRVGRTGVPPQVFRIFGDGGSGNINYATPLVEVPYRASETFYGWTSGQLAGGGEHQLAVRAIATGDVWDEQPAVARVTPDPTAPGEVGNLKAEVIL